MIIDDVFSTGGTIKSVIEGLNRTKAKLVNVVIVVEKGDGMERLKRDYPEVKFDSLVKLEMQGENIVLSN